MKTIEKIKEEIKEIKLPYISISGHIKEHESDRVKLNGKIRQLLQFIAYLETNPSEAFVRSELERLYKKMEILENRFPQWNANVTKQEIGGADPRKYYESANDYATIKKQIKTLKYLLEE